MQLKTRMPRAHDRVFTAGDCRKYLARSEEDVIVIPAIFITVLAGNPIGNGLRDSLNPRLRK